MKKTHPDGTGFAATWEVPDNVKELVEEIEQRCLRTYPDHQVSREKMFRQELINALSESTGKLERVLNLTGEAAEALLEWHQKLLFPFVS